MPLEVEPGCAEDSVVRKYMHSAPLVLAPSNKATLADWKIRKVVSHEECTVIPAVFPEFLAFYERGGLWGSRDCGHIQGDHCIKSTVEVSVICRLTPHYTSHEGHSPTYNSIG